MKKEEYAQSTRKEYPKVESLGNNTFGYSDELTINNLNIYIIFLCNKTGLPVGSIANTYFNYPDYPNVTSPNWLVDYKKDLLTRIKDDLENKKEKER